MDRIATAVEQEMPPLVAIGASAGGLEPLEAFFEAAPDAAGWSFVVIRHLSADGDSNLARLLARRTGLAIREIEEGMTLCPDTLYLNPPGQLVELAGRSFRLRPLARDADGAVLRPIDTFFSSMAGRDPRRTFAVILSGAGSDGTRGAQAVRESGGMVLVQSPQEAGFAAMPGSALKAGAVNRVLSAPEIPGAIRARLQEAAGTLKRPAPVARTAAQAILDRLQESHGLELSAYRSKLLLDGLEAWRLRRCRPSLSVVRDELIAHPELIADLYRQLFQQGAAFYRDPEAIGLLRRAALEPLAAQEDPEAPIRVWVPGCADGQEAYTIAIELAEALRLSGSARSFRIIATDIDSAAIGRAAAGRFPATALAGLPQALRDRYFRAEGDMLTVAPVLRQRVIFSTHDVLRDPPFLNIDLISCRNLIGALTEAAQQRVLSMFIFGLRPGGHLMLGPQESLGRHVIHFRILDSRWRLFRGTMKGRVVDPAMVVPPRPDTPPRSAPAEAPATPQRAEVLRIQTALLAQHDRPELVIAPWGQVMACHGAAAAYVTPGNGRNRSIREVLHHDLQSPVSVALGRLRHDQLDRFERHLTVMTDTGEAHALQLSARPLEMPGGGPAFLLLSLERTDRHSAPVTRLTGQGPQTADVAVLQHRLQEMERDLRLTEVALEQMTEKLEASSEELESSNEELLATNEELQAANEELRSSNEELHAVNEELVVLSGEHQRRMERLGQEAEDGALMFEALGLGTVLLDDKLNLQRVSERARRDFGLTEDECTGPLSAIAGKVALVDLEALAREVQATGEPASATGASRGAALTIRARLLPSGRPGSGRRRVLLALSRLDAGL
ncbi:hypothetical protein KM176_21445 [Pseudooceanicola sp. CBS1P-1]|nr:MULTISPECIES: chemotaxis protein CheB [Pseudooceanicola]MBT9386446.1 hypothetical protein [Pseudooceanicola endophyticus]